MNVKIKKLIPEAVIPTRATADSAGYDLVVPQACWVQPGRQVIPLGLAIELPRGYEAKVEPRSGYSSKGFVGILAVTQYRFDADVIPGKIDADFRGGIGVIVVSREKRGFLVMPGQRIAQLTIYKCEDAEFEEVEELTETERACGGFGHSGN